MSTGKEQVEIPEFHLIDFMKDTTPLFGMDVYHVVHYLLIFVCLSYIYNKVFRVRKLPVLKNAVVYFLIALGAFVLLIFQVDARLPIVYSLVVAVVLMLVVRIRYWLQEKRGGGQREETGEEGRRRP